MTLTLLLACLLLAALLYVALVGGAEKRNELETDVYERDDQIAELTWALADRDAEIRRLQRGSHPGVSPVRVSRQPRHVRAVPTPEETP